MISVRRVLRNFHLRKTPLGKFCIFYVILNTFERKTIKCQKVRKKNIDGLLCPRMLKDLTIGSFWRGGGHL